MLLLSKLVAPFTFGYTTQGSSSGTYTGITAVQAVLAKAGTLQSISWPVAGSSGPNILLGIYSDVSGVPSALLASSASTPSVAGVNTLPVPGNIVLNAGTYWIAVQCQVGISGYYNATGKGAWNNGVAWTGTLPASWPTGSTGAFQYTLSATLLG
jgi:hypothetical protein